MSNLVGKADKFLFDYIEKSNIDEVEKKYRYEHSLRVTNIGIELAKREGADVEITTLACLLHDVGKFDTDKNIDHGRVSAKVARGFLETLDLPKKKIDDICYAIAVHVDGKAGYEYEKTIESEVVSDADNIDRFAAYRFYEMMKYDFKEGLSKKENEEKLEKRINLMKEYHKKGIMGTKSGNEWFRKHLELGIQYFENYLWQLKFTALPKFSE